jgi:hypothetical protein
MQQRRDVRVIDDAEPIRVRVLEVARHG